MMLLSCKIKLKPTSCTPQIETLDSTFLANLSQNKFQIGTISLHAKAELIENGSAQNFDIHFRIVEDSAVWARVSSIGIEGMRVLVERDSVIMINRLNKTYIHTSTDYLRELTGQDFSLKQLQNFLVGNPIHASGTLKRNQNDLYGDFLSAFVNGMNYSYLLNDCYRLNGINTKDPSSDQSVITEYSDFRKVRKRGVIPGKINVHIKGGKKNTTLKLQYNNVSTEGFQSLRIRVPSRYANALE